MSDRFNDSEIIEDMAFLFDGGLPPEIVTRLHRESLPDLERLVSAETLYFVVGSYSEPQKIRLNDVCEWLSNPKSDEAFMLDEIDPDIDVWENFYVKFRVFLTRCHHVVGVFEDNNGGHELEIGEADISNTYILKRDYTKTSVNNDVEHDKFDAMLGTFFNLLDNRGHLYRWTSIDELKEQTEKLSANLRHKN